MTVPDQTGRGRSEVQRLVPEFVGGDEKDTHGQTMLRSQTGGLRTAAQYRAPITVFGVSGSFQVFPSGTLVRPRLRR